VALEVASRVVVVTMLPEIVPIVMSVAVLAVGVVVVASLFVEPSEVMRDACVASLVVDVSVVNP